MRLDLRRWLVPAHRPAILPIAGRLDPPLLKPHLEGFGDNDRS